MNFLEKVRKPLEAMYFVAAIVGIPLILFQLVHDSKIRMVEHTLEFASRLDSEVMIDARYELIQPWLAYSEELRELNRKGGLPRAEIDYLVAELIRLSAANESGRDMRVAIHMMADFYDQLWICIESNLCDREVAELYFSDFALEFSCLYGTPMRQLRQELATPKLGVGIESLSSGGEC